MKSTSEQIKYQVWSQVSDQVWSQVDSQVRDKSVTKSVIVSKHKSGSIFNP